MLANSLAKSSRDFLLSWFPSLSESSDSSQELNGTHFFASSKLHYPNIVLAVAVVRYTYININVWSRGFVNQIKYHSVGGGGGWLGCYSILHIKAKAKQASDPPESEYLVKLAVNGWVIVGQCSVSGERWSGIIHPILYSGGSCICCLASPPLPSQCKARYKIFYNSILTQNIFPAMSSL